MRVLTATEAISPAFARTRLLLFSPFLPGRSWKLAATAYVSVAGTMFLPFPLLAAFALPVLWQHAPPLVSFLVAGGALFLLAIGIWLFALCSRLQFAFFDVVLNRGEFVAPAWRRYGAIARPWTRTKIWWGFAYTIFAGLCLWPLVHKLVLAVIELPRNFPQGASSVGSSPFPPLPFLQFMLSLYAFYFVLALVFGLYYLALSTSSAFMVPSMALEGDSPRLAWTRFTSFARRQPGPLAGFIGMRLLMAFAGYMVVSFAYQIVFFALVVAAGLVAWLGYLLLHAMHVPLPILFVLAAVLAVLLMVGANGYLLLLSMGTFFTFFEAHTLCFLAGRYPPLGELLERSTPAPQLPPPAPGYGWVAPPGMGENSPD